MRLRKPISLLMLAAIVALSATVAGAENGSGTISGTVRLIGSPPSIPTVPPQMDFDMCGSVARPTQSLLLGPNQTVRNVIVYLAGYAQNSASNGTNNAIIIDQRDCEFVPRIQIARSGVPLILRNSDPILHVVRIDLMSNTNGPRTLLKVATPYAGYEKLYQFANFREPTLLQVTSGNGHEWMAAYIAVLPHPWAALTDENGRFTLHNVPAGTHRIYAWHEALGTLVHDVHVNGEGSTTTDFQFSTAH
jgi:hypothetical protein